MSDAPAKISPLDGRKFVAIGKIIFETPGFSWNIPHTHFIVSKTASGLFEATNLELILDSVGKTVRDAADTLSRLTANYIMEIMFRRRGHDELVEVMDTGVMEDYWREYRKIEANLSRSKEDLSHNLDRQWVAAIKETMDESIREIIYEIAKQDAEKMFNALRDKIPKGMAVSFEIKTVETLAA